MPAKSKKRDVSKGKKANKSSKKKMLSVAKKRKDYKKGGEKLALEVKKGKKEEKIGKVMEEFKKGALHSGSKKGPKVKNPKQAIAIALSEARRAVKKKKRK